jgi:hypothetical protein
LSSTSHFHPHLAAPSTFVDLKEEEEVDDDDDDWEEEQEYATKIDQLMTYYFEFGSSMIDMYGGFFVDEELIKDDIFYKGLFSWWQCLIGLYPSHLSSYRHLTVEELHDLKSIHVFPCDTQFRKTVVVARNKMMTDKAKVRADSKRQSTQTQTQNGRKVRRNRRSGMVPIKYDSES